MSITAILWRARHVLIQSFHIAAMQGMLDTWNRCGRLATTPHEADFVAGFALQSTPIIRSALHSILSPRNLSVSVCSVFCHQTPQVSFGASPSASCELGDILFAYVHTPRTGNPWRNAILFQAKASGHDPYRVQAADFDQLQLYKEWPDFKYSRSSFLNGQARVVTPKAPHAGAQYLLINNRPPIEPMSGFLGFPGMYLAGCCMPDELLQIHTDLATELFNLFIFRTGRSFDSKSVAATKLGWSQVVWDLIESGLMKWFRRKNCGRLLCPRNSCDRLQELDGSSFAWASSLAACSTVSDLVGLQSASIIYGRGDGVPPDDHDQGSDSQEPESGVSVVLIETSELESEG